MHHPYAQELADTAETLITAHRAGDSETLARELDALTTTKAQDVITAILIRTVTRDQAPEVDGVDE